MQHLLSEQLLGTRPACTHLIESGRKYGVPKARPTQVSFHHLLRGFLLRFSHCWWTYDFNPDFLGSIPIAPLKAGISHVCLYGLSSPRSWSSRAGGNPCFSAAENFLLNGVRRGWHQLLIAHQSKPKRDIKVPPKAASHRVAHANAKSRFSCRPGRFSHRRSRRRRSWTQNLTHHRFVSFGWMPGLRYISSPRI